MMKLTKRKGFNFFRSYFDVYNELDDKNKVAFIDALFNRQFLGIKPTKLTGMAKFAYISQTNSIDSQVRGYEDKTKTTLLDPTVGGAVGVKNNNLTPTLQVQEKEKEKVQDVYTDHSFKILQLYDLFVKEVKMGRHDIKIEQLYIKLRIKKGSLTDLLRDFKAQLIIDEKLHKNTNELIKHFNNWLNTQERVGKLDKYKTQKQGAL